jgi:hypothetical protein
MIDVGTRRDGATHVGALHHEDHVGALRVPSVPAAATAWPRESIVNPVMISSLEVCVLSPLTPSGPA